MIEQFVNQNEVNLVLEFENNLRTVYKIYIMYSSRYLYFYSKLLLEETSVFIVVSLAHFLAVPCFSTPSIVAVVIHRSVW